MPKITLSKKCAGCLKDRQSGPSEFYSAKSATEGYYLSTHCFLTSWADTLSFLGEGFLFPFHKVVGVH